MKRESGVASLEALFSLTFLLLFFFLLWDSSKIIYDKSRLDTASQYSAQAAVLYFARSAPTNCSNIACDGVQAGAERKAQAVFEGNATLGMMNSKGVESKPVFDDFKIEYLCAASSSGSAEWKTSGCNYPRAYRANVVSSQKIDWTIGVLGDLLSTTVNSSASATANNPELPGS